MSPDYFKHELAIVESNNIGTDTRIWAFAHVLPGAKIGSNCNVCDHTFIENDVVIGNNVTIKCGVYIWDAMRIKNFVFIGPNATFTNDKFPRSKKTGQISSYRIEKGLLNWCKRYHTTGSHNRRKCNDRCRRYRNKRYSTRGNCNEYQLYQVTLSNLN